MSSQLQWCHGDHFLPGNPCSSHQPQGRAPVQDLGSFRTPGPTPDRRPEVSREAAPLTLMQALRDEENTARKQKRQFNAQGCPLTMQGVASRPEGLEQFFTSYSQHAGGSRCLPDPQKPGAFTESTPPRHTVKQQMPHQASHSPGPRAPGPTHLQPVAQVGAGTCWTLFSIWDTGGRPTGPPNAS